MSVISSFHVKIRMILSNECDSFPWTTTLLLVLDSHVVKEFPCLFFIVTQPADGVFRGIHTLLAQ